MHSFLHKVFQLAEEMGWKEQAIHWIAEYRYWGVFLFLIACGLGFPAPEEIALIGGGYAVYTSDPNSWTMVLLMVLTAMIGVLVGDVMLYYIGRRVGETPQKVWIIGRHLTPARMRRVRAMFRKHGAKAVFFGRFLFGIRAVTFFVSGSMRVPIWTFILMDGLAALLTVPISVILAWHFGGELEEAFRWIGNLDKALLIGLSIAALVAGIFYMRRRKRKLAEVDEHLIAVESESELAALSPEAAQAAGAAKAESAAAAGAEPAPDTDEEPAPLRD